MKGKTARAVLINGAKESLPDCSAVQMGRLERAIPTGLLCLPLIPGPAGLAGRFQDG